jgi:hypothetical protein
VGGGAWPFLVGEMICQFNYDNERDGIRKLWNGKREFLSEVIILDVMWIY